MSRDEEITKAVEHGACFVRKLHIMAVSPNTFRVVVRDPLLEVSENEEEPEELCAKKPRLETTKKHLEVEKPKMSQQPQGTVRSRFTDVRHRSGSSHLQKYTEDSFVAQNRKSMGLVGLDNLGNTCFLNCILQCLMNTSELRDYCLSNAFSEELAGTNDSKSLMAEFVNLMKQLWNPGEHRAISPKRFQSKVQRIAPEFAAYDQQDAQEFLRFLLDKLHDELNRGVKTASNPLEDFSYSSNDERARIMWNIYTERENSKIIDLFAGQLRSSLTCSECCFQSTVFEPFWDLSIPIKQMKARDVNLRDCLKLFTKVDILDGDERPKCNSCNFRTMCSKRFEVQRFPQVLVIHLKRFSYFEDSKLSTYVDFPLKDLNLQEFSAEKSETPIYNLFAVANHSGSTLHGHYTAYCKNKVKDQWYNFNDCRVSPISPKDVCSSNAYLLFYELVSLGENRKR